MITYPAVSRLGNRWVRGGLAGEIGVLGSICRRGGSFPKDIDSTGLLDGAADRFRTDNL